MYGIPKEIVEISRELRKNMTQAEKGFWIQIKGEKTGVKFLRQHPLYISTEDSGFHRFVIPDFYNYDLKLIIEVDGSIHDIPEILELDTEKEFLLSNMGYTIIRFSNTEIFEDIDTCISKLLKTIKYLQEL